MDFTTKLIHLCCSLAAVFGLSTLALCENSQLCQLGASVVEEMSFQLSANGKIDPTTLNNSAAFLEKCPGTVMQSFDRLAIDKEALHRAWISALISNGSHSDLDTLLAAIHRSVVNERSRPLEEFLDGIFNHSSISAETSEKRSSNLDQLFEQQASSTLVQFSHCDAAECYDISDILLFLLGSHPAAFWSAMHSNSAEATKWLSQLQDVSFAGEPSQAQPREQIRKVLLTQISVPAATSFQDEKSQCIKTLNQISYHPWQ